MDLVDRLRASRAPTTDTAGGEDQKLPSGEIDYAQPADILRVGKMGGDPSVRNHAGVLADPGDEGFANAFDNALKAFNGGTATQEQIAFLEQWAPVMGIKG